MVKTILVPGSFDPITQGHIAMITYASTLAGQVYVGILDNDLKTPMFNLEERRMFAEKATASFSNVKVVSFHGETYELYKKINADAMLRGLRGVKDVIWEQQILDFYKKEHPECRTLFWLCPSQLAGYSSTQIREMLQAGQDITPLMPVEIGDCIQKYYDGKIKKQ